MPDDENYFSEEYQTDDKTSSTGPNSSRSFVDSDEESNIEGTATEASEEDTKFIYGLSKPRRKILRGRIIHDSGDDRS